ncbi:MAG TPA: 4a-hydroxytetrahydrobiopterin dehydratase, partial [Miltoncostaeaceae bacterium]|nr:4a-hydroxytetrahydrobiopterin dehydratase [Miltoncostaeaceae bacterium]
PPEAPLPLLDDDQIRSALAGLPGWERDGDALVREFTHADFLQAVLFVNRVAGAAEAADHHPDVDIRWNRVLIRLSTHSAGGVTDRDVALAGRISGLA